MITGHGETPYPARSTSQTWESKLGTATAAYSCYRYRVRIAGSAIRTHEEDIYHFGPAPSLVRAQQESVLHTRMAAC